MYRQQNICSMNDKNFSGFAEIEYDTGFHKDKDVEKAVQFFSNFTPPQTIEYKPVDPIRQKFFDMRSLASDRPFARDDSELFYRQAKFMEDFTDGYEGEAKLNMYYPYYQHMGYEQLRTYFTWRTKVRNGELKPIHTSYIFLYVYEMLSNVGVKDLSEALDNLITLFNECKEVSSPLAKYLPRWIKDFIIYYGMPFSFESFVDEYGLHRYYPELFLFELDNENIALCWSSISNYDVTASKFYQDGNEQLISDYFRAVLVALEEYFAKKKMRLQDLIIYRISNKVLWTPFKQALFYSTSNKIDRQVNLPGKESYFCRNNRWTTSYPIYYSNRESVAGHLVKKTEACLREILKYKYKLKISPTPFRHAQITARELDVLVERAVYDYHKYVNRTVVNVDHANLERIRVEALGTQDKLIVDDASFARNAECIMHNEELGVRSEELGVESDEWNALKDVLSQVELGALNIALSDSMSAKVFADENGVMLEVLADSINEKAVDIIGDSIIEVDEGLIIYDDYVEIIRDMLGIEN